MQSFRNGCSQIRVRISTDTDCQDLSHAAAEIMTDEMQFPDAKGSYELLEPLRMVFCSSGSATRQLRETGIE